MILLVTGSSTEPALFHAGCRPSLHVGIYLLWHLYLTTCQKGPPLTSDHGRNTFTTMLERNLQHSHLTMGGTHPRAMLERFNTYIWPWEEQIQEPCQKGPAITFTSMIGHTYYHVWKGPVLTTIIMIGHTYYHLWKGPTLATISMIGHTYYHLWKGPSLTTISMIGHAYYLLWKGLALTTSGMVGHNYYHPWKGSALTTDHVGANPIVISEWIYTYIWSCGSQSHSHIRMDLHLYLIMWEPIP